MNRYQYIAEQFHTAINSNSIKRTKLIRYTIRYRTPAILELIKEIYNNNYEKTFGEELNAAAYADNRTRDLLFLLLKEKKKKFLDMDTDEQDDNVARSRGIPMNDFETDSEYEEEDDDNEKEGVIDEIQIVRDNGDIETI